MRKVPIESGPAGSSAGARGGSGPLVDGCVKALCAVRNESRLTGNLFQTVCIAGHLLHKRGGRRSFPFILESPVTRMGSGTAIRNCPQCRIQGFWFLSAHFTRGETDVESGVGGIATLALFFATRSVSLLFI